MTDPTANPIPEQVVDPYRYDLALDEIRALRAGAAHEARLIENLLRLSTLPISARRQLAETRLRLLQAARGEWDDAWWRMDNECREALKLAGAPEGFTREEWEAERL